LTNVVFHSYDYVKPGCKRRRGTRGVDYFNGEDELLVYVRSDKDLCARHGISNVVVRWKDPIGAGKCGKSLYSYTNIFTLFSSRSRQASGNAPTAGPKEGKNKECYRKATHQEGYFSSQEDESQEAHQKADCGGSCCTTSRACKVRQSLGRSECARYVMRVVVADSTLTNLERVANDGQQVEAPSRRRKAVVIIAWKIEDFNRMLTKLY
ncbi:hypothetical protein PHMEG_00031667, partial [Phytophthora megakarya]